MMRVQLSGDNYAEVGQEHLETRLEWMLEWPGMRLEWSGMRLEWSGDKAKRRMRLNGLGLEYMASDEVGMAWKKG